jgi:hypothetical protein
MDQQLGVVHLSHRMFLDGLVEPIVAPIVTHLRVHHLLADGGQLIRQELGQYRRQHLDALHFLPHLSSNSEFSSSILPDRHA